VSQGTIERPETWASGHQSTLQLWCENRNGLAERERKRMQWKLTVKWMKRRAVGIIKWKKKKNNRQQETEDHGWFNKLKRGQNEVW